MFQYSARKNQSTTTVTGPRLLAAPIACAILAAAAAQTGDAQTFVDTDRLQSDLVTLAKCELFAGALQARGRQKAFLAMASANIRLSISVRGSPDRSRTETVSYIIVNLLNFSERRHCARLSGHEAAAMPRLGLRQWIDDATRIGISGSYSPRIFTYSANLQSPESGPITAWRMRRTKFGAPVQDHVVDAELEVPVGSSVRRSSLAWPTFYGSEHKG
jgi:hypothetical protein